MANAGKTSEELIPSGVSTMVSHLEILNAPDCGRLTPKENFVVITEDKKCIVDELKSVEAIVRKLIADYSLVLPSGKEQILDQSCKTISDLVKKMEEIKECIVVEISTDLEKEKQSEGSKELK